MTAMAIWKTFAVVALAFLAGSGLAGYSPAGFALDYVTIRQGEKQRELAGKIEVEAVDGGVMLLARDGALWPVEKENLVSRRSDAKPFASFTQKNWPGSWQRSCPASRLIRRSIT